MSISEIQKSTIFAEVARAYYMSGRKPRLIDVMHQLSDFFAENPIGQPLDIPIDSISSGMTSNPHTFNEIIARLAFNIDVLYKANDEQLRRIMSTTTLFNSEIEALKAKRKALVSKIDDYLFSLYNSDGYYYSYSDGFANLSKVDLNLTSAFVNTKSNVVTIPPIASMTDTLKETDYVAHSIQVKDVAADRIVSHLDYSPFRGCVDGLSNTVWSTQVVVDEPKELVLKLVLRIGRVEAPEISKIEIDPYCVTPIQMWVETEKVHTPVVGGVANIGNQVELFGREINSSSLRFIFTDEPRKAGSIIIYMRKTQPDYELYEGQNIKYMYMFGAKDLIVSKHTYDNEAVFVSQPITIPEELDADHVIDSVSLVVKDQVPPNTSIEYFVANDSMEISDPELGDFEWKPIDPVDNNDIDGVTRVTFNGAKTFTRYIREDATGSDIEMIPLDTTNVVLASRNPSPVIVPGSDIYRIASMEDSFLPSSIKIEEGVNSTRIIYTSVNDDALDLDYWVDYLNGDSTPVDKVYGRIDTGNEFFYGGDVGEAGVSVYVETYLESMTDQELYLRTFTKSDTNSRQWDVKVYLNGREIADMPAGTDQMLLPWKFQQGLNHICMLINIPNPSTTYPNVYIGTLSLMNESALYDFGTVKLDTWQYVDLHHMQYNEVGEPNSFTIYEGEIVSRRKPSDNLRLRYSKATDRGPAAIRVRANLSRDIANSSVTPSLHQYRLRFIYS